jgi:phosphoribosylformylglycinamidine synthase
MEPFEVMISESQERMLAVVRPERLEDVLSVCRRWNLAAAVVAEITHDGDVVVADGEAEIARIPARALASDVPEQHHLAAPPQRRRAAPAPGETPLAHDGLPERGMDPGLVLEAIVGHANLASRNWVTSQYDQTVGTDTIEGCERATAVVRIKGTTKALVMATDSQALAGHDAYLGAALAVAECARNIAVAGARPLGLTNCLNFGDPNVPEAYWQLGESVRGLGDACRALGIPVTGGNVSLYNESLLGRIAPTAQIGIVGLLDDIDGLVRPQFAAAGDLVVLLGETGPGMVGSAYERLAGAAPDDRPPSLDLAREVALHALLRQAAHERLLRSGQDVSGGGLAVAVAECAIWSGLGAELQLQVPLAPAVALFGESPGRALVTVSEGSWAGLARLAASNRIACLRLGVVGGDRVRIRLVGVGATGAAEERGAGVADELDVSLADLARAWRQGLPRALGEVA